MKYKIKNHIIDAKSPTEALKIHKLLDSKLKDSYIYTEVGQEYSEIIRSLKSKGFNVIIMGNASGYGKYIKIEGSKDKLKALQNSGYFEEEIIHDSAKDAEPTYRSVWLKVKEYVKSHYNFKYSRDFKGLMNWLNTQYGGILDEDKVYKILRDLNSKGYVMFITDSQEEIDYLTEEEEKAVDDYRQAIANTNNPKLLKLYQHILGEELEHIEELSSAEVVEDSIKDERPDREKIDAIQKNARNVGGRLASVVVDDDIDNKGLYISRMYINTTGTWLETPAEADDYLHQLQSAIAYFKANYKYKGK